MKKFNPKVSIVIPVYNGAKYLGEAIDSALAQTYENIEIIVSNDGSNDNSATDRVAKSYGKKIIYLNKKENGGASTALNAAIKVMTGEYFSWLSHDDKYYPNKIKRQIEELSKLKDKNTIMMSDLDGINEKYEKIYETKYIDRIKEYPLREKSYIYPVLYNQTHGCTLLIPKVCFDEVGLFDVGEIVAQDFEFFNRAFSKFPHKLIPEVLVTARDTSNRMGRRAKPRASVEYSRLYISILDNMSDEDINLVAPDKLTLFFDMYMFFKQAGYKQAYNYIVNRIKLEIPIHAKKMLNELLTKNYKAISVRLFLQKMNTYMECCSSQDKAIEEMDLVFKKILDELSDKELNDYFINNQQFAVDLYVKFNKFGYKRTASSILHVLIDELTLVGKENDAVEIIYNQIVGKDDSLQISDTKNIIKKIKKKSNKKRILFCSTHWLTGGMERVMSNLFEQINSEYEIYLITPFDGRLGKIKLPEYVTHIKVSNGMFYNNFDGAILSYALMLDIKVVIGFYNMLESQLSLYELCNGTNIKTIASNHEYYFYPYKHEGMREIVPKRLKAFSCVDAVLWPTNFSSAIYGLGNDNAYMIGNPNSYKIHSGNIKKRSQKMIICVGRFNDNIKRIDRILSCFTLVLQKEPEAKLIIIGKCDRDVIINKDDGMTVNDWLAQLNINEKSVTFTGEVNNVEEYYNQASLILLASNNEGFGMVVNEAACFGVPSVCNYYPGVEDLVIDGKNGYITEQDDIDSMSDRVCRILSDDKLRDKLGENAKEYAKKFDAKIIGNKWKYLLKTLTNKEISEKDIKYSLNRELAYSIYNQKKFNKVIFDELNHIYNNTGKITSEADISVDAILNSVSWRITKPIRLVGRGLRSVRNRGVIVTTKSAMKKIYIKLI